MRTWEIQILFKVGAETQEEAVQKTRDFIEEHLKGRVTGLSVADKPNDESYTLEDYREQLRRARCPYQGKSRKR